MTSYSIQCGGNKIKTYEKNTFKHNEFGIKRKSLICTFQKYITQMN